MMGLEHRIDRLERAPGPGPAGRPLSDHELLSGFLVDLSRRLALWRQAVERFDGVDLVENPLTRTWVHQFIALRPVEVEGLQGVAVGVWSSWKWGVDWKAKARALAGDLLRELPTRETNIDGDEYDPPPIWSLWRDNHTHDVPFDEWVKGPGG